MCPQLITTDPLLRRSTNQKLSIILINYYRIKHSLIIKNLPVSISKKIVFKTLSELELDITFTTRLQNCFKCPIPIVVVLLTHPKKEKKYSKTGQLHCIVLIQPKSSLKGIPQCTHV